jgi:hypothetical protein
MQKIYPRTNPAPFGASENSNVIPAPQIEEVSALEETATRQGFAGAQLSLPSIKLEAKLRSQS